MADVTIRVYRRPIQIVTNPIYVSSGGGGGGGAVDSVDGRTGTVVLTDLYEPINAASSAISTHVGLADPHTQYALESALGTAASKNVGTGANDVAAGNHTHATLYEPINAVSNHVSLSDPHTQYLKETDAILTTQTLTDAATISVDWSAGNCAKVTLGGARTLGTPTNAVANTMYRLVVYQDATGDRSLDFPSSFVRKPEIRRQANECTVLDFFYDGTSYHLEVDGWIRIRCTSDASDSTPALTDVPGCAFTPIAGAIYEFRVAKAHTSAAATTGCQWSLNAGNAAVFASYGVDQNTAGTTQIQRFRFDNSASNILGVGTVGAASSGHGFGQETGVFQAHATSPTQMKLQFQTEVAGSQVTVKAGLTSIWLRRLS